MVAGVGVLGVAEVLPAFWSRGVSPLPPCVFHLLTGQPCPLCGGTRSFVAMAHGNLGAAARVYPIGPLLFIAMLAAIAYGAAVLLTGRRVRLRLSYRQRRVLLALGVGVLAANWAAKLFVLGY